MSIVDSDPLFSWFGIVPWYLRYLLFVLLVYVPAILITIKADTFRGNSKCDIPFVSDYTFHINWIAAIPIFLALLPWFFSHVDDTLLKLHNNSGGLSFLSKNEFKSVLKYQKSIWFPLSGALCGITVAGIVAIVNLRSLKLATQTRWSWWFPSGTFCAGTVLFLLICALVTAIGFSVLLRYAHVIIIVRTSVLKLSRIPLWIASSPGPLSNLFQTFFITFLPLLLVPICVFIARTFRGQIELTDPVTVLNILAGPIGIIAFFIAPCVLTGIPQKLNNQRSVLLATTNQEIDSVISTMDKQLLSSNYDAVTQRMQYLNAKKEFISNQHPVWPLPSFKASLSALGAFIVATISTIAALVTILDKLGPKLP